VLARSIDELEEHARAGREARVLDLLHRLVPEYRGDPEAGRKAPAVATGSP
jgi:hypothetical protein